VFEKERPVDTLARLLSASGGSIEAEPVQAFFHRHLPADQAIAVALVLATRPAGGDLAFWASTAAFKYGGEPNATGTVDFQPSPLHMGLFRFTGRLVASIWKRSVAASSSSSLGPVEDLETLIGQLKALSHFMTLNSAFILRKASPSALPRVQEAYQVSILYCMLFLVNTFNSLSVNR